MKTEKKKKMKEQGKNKYPEVRAKIDEWASTGEKCSFVLPPNPSATNPPKPKRSQNVSKPRTKSLQIRGSRTHLSLRLF